MAIYSLRMTAVGKTTQKQPFTAAAHLKYITRREAVTHVMSGRMPDVRRQAMAWLKREEREDRKNARVIDKMVLALPKELSAAQQHALVKAFAEDLTQGKASWFAAFHTKGKDAGNPHCHLILRDRDVETKKRVMFLSAGMKEAAERRDKGKAAPTTLATVRVLWERHANAALARAGREERIDRRSLKEQGIGRRAQVHEGPNIRAMHRRGFRPASRDRVVRNAPLRRRGRSLARVVRYAEIDRGKTRVEFNAALRETRTGTGDRVPNRRVAAQGGISEHWGWQELGRGGDRMKNDPAPVLSGREVPSPAPEPVSPARELSLTELLGVQHNVPLAQPNPPIRDRDRGRTR